MDNYSLILDFIDYILHLYSFCPRMADMAFKRSAVRSRLSPPKSLKLKDFKAFFFIFFVFFGVSRTSPESDIFEEISNTYNTTYNRNITKRDIKDRMDELFLLFLLCLIHISQYCQPLVFRARGYFYVPRFKRSAV